MTRLAWLVLVAACSRSGEPARCPGNAKAIERIAQDGSRDRFCEVLGKREGPAQRSFASGQIAESVSYFDDKRVGAGTVYYENGQRAEAGEWLAGERDGTWIYWDDAGVLLERVTYRAGSIARTEDFLPSCASGTHLTGEAPPRGVAVWCQRPGFQGDLANHGPFAAWYEDGRLLARGTYEEGHQEGPFAMWYPSGRRKALGVFKHGKQEGAWLSWHDNGVKFIEATFVSGDEEGAWSSWWEEGGKSAEGQFLHGWEEGAWTFWHPNGKPSQTGSYREGKRTGWWKRWDAEGQEQAMVEYRAGVEIGTAP